MGGAGQDILFFAVFGAANVSISHKGNSSIGTDSYYAVNYVSLRANPSKNHMPDLEICGLLQDYAFSPAYYKRNHAPSLNREGYAYSVCYQSDSLFYDNLIGHMDRMSPQDEYISSYISRQRCFFILTLVPAATKSSRAGCPVPFTEVACSPLYPSVHRVRS